MTTYGVPSRHGHTSHEQPCHKTMRYPAIARTHNRDWTAGASGDDRKGHHDAQEKHIDSALFGFALSHRRYADGSAAYGSATHVAGPDGHARQGRADDHRGVSAR